MRANPGDRLLMHGRVVGRQNREAEVVEVLGADGEPPFRVRFEDGHEAILSPGPDTVVRERNKS
ncbi:DUF1918 domain-containing protein [Streptomyces boncukensis]|uniref:DUF1918 domain-containing protein n=1 Tax=Streptomyces boncukensis TaxID=2711219 RepID=A0A6G4X9P0_9ACTN|nr:DUF1918 domain-containing protein [Streptomyces boncukensis]NGO73557.1 DUF1918 domain-containing protein [Streptomyces boncukensis]